MTIDEIKRENERRKEDSCKYDDHFACVAIQKAAEVIDFLLARVEELERREKEVGK